MHVNMYLYTQTHMYTRVQRRLHCFENGIGHKPVSADPRDLLGCPLPSPCLALVLEASYFSLNKTVEEMGFNQTVER